MIALFIIILSAGLRSQNIDQSLRYFADVPIFDPSTGVVIAEPPGSGPGYWAGAPAVIFDADRGKFYLYYRLRWPRGAGRFDRGGECRIAESTDGVNFKVIWRATKDQFPTLSVERGCIVKTPEGKYRLYIGLIDTADNRWKIDMMEADDPSKFDPSDRIEVLTADMTNGEGVKDPYIIKIGSSYWMYFSYAPKPESISPEEEKQLHATADVFMTGYVSSLTGLAISQDGINFHWNGIVLGSGKTWDRWCSRLTTIIPTPPFFTAYYDGAGSVEENYEEKTAIAITFDLRNFERLSLDGPALLSPYASGSIRYVEAIRVKDKIYFYYEFARSDGSHELRVSVIKWK
jgi:hypothetical protein